MASRKKNTSPNKSDKKDESKIWWKTPAIIVGLLTLLGTIITTLPDMLRALNETKSMPTSEPAPIIASSPDIQTNFCNDYFSSDAIIIQSGIPKKIDTKGKNIVEIKLMNNSTLIGGIKFLTESRYVYTSDHNCAEVKPPFSIDFDTNNTIEFEEFVLKARFPKATRFLEMELTKK